MSVLLPYLPAATAAICGYFFSSQSKYIDILVCERLHNAAEKHSDSHMAAVPMHPHLDTKFKLKLLLLFEVLKRRPAMVDCRVSRVFEMSGK